MNSAAHPCVVFAYELPASFISSLPGTEAAFVASASPVLLVHSHYRQLARHEGLSILRLSFLPLLWRCYLTTLSNQPRGSSTTDDLNPTPDEPSLSSVLCMGYQLPATAGGSALTDDANELVELGFCSFLAYSVCVSSINHARCGASGIAASVPLTGPLLTALSTALHLLELLVECHRKLTAQLNRFQAESSPAPWLSSYLLLQQAIDSLERVDAEWCSALLQFGLSSPSDPSGVPLLRRLYDAAYRSDGVDKRKETFVETGFFSLLHLMLGAGHLFRWGRDVDGFVSLSSTIFIRADLAVRKALTSTRTSASSSSLSSSSTSSLPRHLSSHPLDTCILSSCASSTTAASSADVLASITSSLDVLCSLEKHNRRECPQLPHHSTPQRSRLKKPPPVSAASATSSVTAATPSGKDELKEEEETETLFRRTRKRLRRAPLALTLEERPTTTPPCASAPMQERDAPAVVVHFIAPDHASQLQVADCLSLLSRSSQHAKTHLLPLVRCRLGDEHSHAALTRVDLSVLQCVASCMSCCMPYSSGVSVVRSGGIRMPLNCPVRLLSSLTSLPPLRPL